MAEQNSLSTLLPELLRLFNNSLQSFEKVNQAITSNRESVTIDLQNQDGRIQKVTIPSFGFLKNSIERLDSNIDTITNLTGAGSSLRLPDGTFRKLALSKLPTEAQDLTSINSVNQFEFKSNFFFESLINPLLFVTFDITGQAPIDTERAVVKRYILDTNTQAKINFFDETYKGKSDVDYNDFLEELVTRNISYILDEDVIDLPPRDKRFFGKFSVIRINEVDVTEEINGVSITTTKKLYKLNKLSYSSVDADFQDTVQLKVGDSLEVVSNPVDTRYTVSQVDSTTNSVVLELVEGSKAISIGSDILKISSAADETLNVEVAVGFDERSVVFLKPIDPDSKIPATNWSPGSAFYTNDLTTFNIDGTEQTLAEFYQSQAVDFGKFLLSFANDKIPTSREGLKPNAPTLDSTNFEVKLINGQITNSATSVQIVDLNNQKNALSAEIRQLDQAIDQKRTRIQTTAYATEVEREADKSELRGLITERSSKSDLFASVVTEILSFAEDNSIESGEPKYRVRGFWQMPTERVAPETGVQEIVKFQIRYRYLSADGAANPVDQLTYTDGDTTSQGAFSNYVLVDSVTRARTLDSLTGKYEWADINTENAEEININQLDIPIRKGEIVEISVRSVSEAGWPSNPLISDYSEAIRVEFPADLSSDNAVTQILEQNREDQARIALEEDLETKGIDEHLSSAFTANENYFAHTANVIASGFLSSEQTPIDLFSKLTEFQNSINQFAEILNQGIGELKIQLVDEAGTTIPIARDTVNRVFAGFYSDEVANLDDPKGAIVNKTFFINISNAVQTPLQLISRITGSRLKMAFQSENPGFTLAEAQNGTVILPAVYPYLDNAAAQQSDSRPTYDSADIDYNRQRKYDLTPIVLTNPTVDANNQFGQIKSLAPYQSDQNKNQFIYSRFKDVSSEDSFYSYINPDNRFVINLDTAENFYIRTTQSTGGTSFYWGGGFDAGGNPTVANNFFGSDDDTIDVHVDHPLIASYAAFKAEYERITGDTATLPATVPQPQVGPPAIPGGIDCASNGTAAVVFRHSKFAPLQSDQTKGKQQNIFLHEDVADFPTSATAGFNFPSSLTSPAGAQTFESSPSLSIIPTGADYSRNVKTSFDTFDQYLLGKQSCGSYLFISSDDHENIQVSGDATTSKKTVAFGSQNSLNVPLVFQYRMTDYSGVGTGGTGNIAGDSTGATTNLTYAKKIGFDVYPSLNDVYQFDIEVFAKFRSDNLNTDSFPSATINNSLNDLGSTLNSLGAGSLNDG